MSGKPVWQVRIATYIVASAFAGAGGALYAQINGFLAPYDFDLNLTVLFFAEVVVGGMTNLLGAAIGVFLLYIIPQVVINISGYSDLVYGATVLAAVLLLPDGVEEALRALWQWLVRRVLRTRSQDNREIYAVHPPSADRLGEQLAQLRSGQPDSSDLVIRGAIKAFDGLRALDFGEDDEVAVRPGEVHLLLGPNGSGKTTLLNAMCGLLRLDGGTVRIGQTDVTRAPVARIARLGVSRSYQTPRLPDELSPRDMVSGLVAQLEPISFVHWLVNDPVAGRTRRNAQTIADGLLSAAGLENTSRRPNLWLTSGQRRICDVLVALTSHSRIVLLDEPAAGLSGEERKALGAMIRGLADHGCGFLIVEHDLDLAMSIADRVTVMAGGRVVAHDAPAVVQNDASVREALMGPTS
jgi:branched-chain amino acid transport system permease protein